MRARGNLRAHDGAGGAKQLGHDGFQRVAADIVIAIARGRGKMTRSHMMLGESVQHAARAAQGLRVDLRKACGAILLALRDKGFKIHRMCSSQS